ncbi:hypothetical protein CQZ93_13640 [Ochrobactrum vermis]|nr:hypothetical protein CQZ93_13640 [Ochrobactrum vermis]
MVLAFGIDKLNPGNPDITVGARSIFLNRRRSEGSANGRYLLNCYVSCGRILAARRHILDQTAVDRGNVVKQAAKSIASLTGKITPA